MTQPSVFIGTHGIKKGGPGAGCGAARALGAAVALLLLAAGSAMAPSGGEQVGYRDLRDCVEATWGRTPPLEQVQALLPQGFVAGRALDLIGRNEGVPGVLDKAPLDAGMLGLATFSCAIAGTSERYDFAWLVAYVEPVEVPGFSLLPATADLYLLRLMTDNAEDLAVVPALGFDVVEAQVVAAASSGPLMQGHAAARAGGEVLYDIWVLAADRQVPMDAAWRAWHVGDDGLAYVHMDIAPTSFGLGRVTHCQDPAADLMFGTCEAKDFGGVWPPHDQELTIVHLPGAVVG